jgi:D-3-phosphoglycerate dehydrogenase
MFAMTRFIDQSNRDMPAKGATDFAQLKKVYSRGTEVTGKVLGIVGFGRIGQSAASLALGMGMKVLAYDPFIPEAVVNVHIHNIPTVQVPVKTVSLDDVLKNSDFITLHVPGGEVITEAEIKKMKKGVMLINASRGGVINEDALLAALNTGHVAHAALDVFKGEPTPRKEILQHPKISMTPHIGGSTEEAQLRIGVELAEKIIHFLR